MQLPLILASASPQRVALLQGLGVTFQVIPSSVREDDHPERDPPQRACDLAEAKARDVAAKHPGGCIIGCDTLVVAPDGTLLEKPLDPAHAERMVRLQSHGTSVVHSGLTVIAPDGRAFTGLSSSQVTFKKLSDAEILWWMDTGLWQGRSGAFQIDGLGQLMIAHIQGDWTGIVGLPIFLLGELAAKAGVAMT